MSKGSKKFKKESKKFKKEQKAIKKAAKKTGRKAARNAKVDRTDPAIKTTSFQPNWQGKNAVLGAGPYRASPRIRRPHLKAALVNMHLLKDNRGNDL
jgi:hypothetical protein